MIKDDLTLTGAVSIALNGQVVQEIPNLVVTAGKNWVADRMNNANTVMTHMAIGTSSTTAVVGQTTLVAETARGALTSTNVSANVITYVETFAAGTGTAALTEAGVFDAASGGDMLCRTVFAVVNKGSADSMTITWSITVS